MARRDPLQPEPRQRRHLDCLAPPVHARGTRPDLEQRLPGHGLGSYRQQGDRRFLSEHFDAVCRFVDYLGTDPANHILPRYWIGDWGSIAEGSKKAIRPP